MQVPKNILDKLSKDILWLVQVASVHYSPIPRTELVQSANEVAKRLKSSRQMTYKDIQPQLEQAIDLNVFMLAEGKRLLVNPSLLDLAVQSTFLEGTFETVAAWVQEDTPRREYSFYASTRDEALLKRDVRIAFYRNNVEELVRILSTEYLADHSELRLLEPFNEAVFSRLSKPFKRLVLRKVGANAIGHASGSRESLNLFEDFELLGELCDEEDLGLWLTVLVAKGDQKGLSRLHEHLNGNFEEIAGCEAFLDGDEPKSLALFESAIARLRKKTRKRNQSLQGLPGWLHGCLLIKENNSSSRNKLKTMLKSAFEKWAPPFNEGASFLDAARMLQEEFQKDMRLRDASNGSVYSQLLAGYVWRWFLPADRHPFSQTELANAGAKYETLGLKWFAAEVFGLLEWVEGERSASYGERSTRIHADLSTHSLRRLLEALPAWKRSLEALAEVASQKKSRDEDAGTSQRLIWEIQYSVKSGWVELKPFVQKRSNRGWSKGRNVALSRLSESVNASEYQYLSVQDRALVASIRMRVEPHYYGYRETTFEFDQADVGKAIPGHPHIFRPGERENPMEIVSESPQLLISKAKKGQLSLALHPTSVSGNVLHLREDGPSRLIVTLIDERQKRVADILGLGLQVPESAQAEVLETVGRLAPYMAIHSEVGLGASSSSIEASSKTHIHLLPVSDGLRLELFVRPFGDAGPFYRPGKGGQNVFAEIEGKSVSASRNLDDEKERVRQFTLKCDMVQGALGPDDELHFPEPQDALELVLQLQPLAEDGEVTIHWPKGKSFRVSEVDSRRFSVGIRKDRDWFSASGSLKVDEELSLDLVKLLELIEASKTRFIEVDAGRFVVLSEQLKKRIAELDSFGERRKGKVRFAPIRAMALEDFADEVGAKTDSHWKKAMERVRDAEAQNPKPPSTLRTELRDYQVEGYRWLTRLAHWGVGGCLADDMGLGKTIQALTLLLDRGALGPALVVAPTSVASNWESEVRRFAPTLKAKVFGTGDRDAFFEKLKPRDIVITSYGLMYNEAERFHGVRWSTVILDEAQAIKNMATKRSQVAMKLEAEFRIIMTGTPIENHLGELWNLFNFINPGLLGSFESFQERHAGPIERGEGKEARLRLRKLIQPFLLRRTKAQVLDELPPRTESTLRVTLSQKEAAFYEALRKSAVKKLEVAKGEDTGPQHLRILAEIMRLRRACCHPQLVVGDSDIGSSKLALFSEVIDELMSNGHKVLVFSQFVDHLKIIRNELDRKGIRYQYLDGSTRPKDRKQRVDSFQAGDGDVFLISLKAGGTGLNLTAADYVIHMDPWWNPAVEDQASDRAHRIGQQRPVTIYRFVTAGTIEEKIVDLHHSKRDLADSLLEGAEITGKLSAEALLDLMRSR